DPAQEVEVLVALLVPQQRAVSSHELDRQARVGADHALGLDALQLGERHASSASAPSVILVPMPASVNSSSSSECGVRPSRMCAAETPASIAWRHASSFGRMPPSSLSSAPRTSS